MSSRMLHCVVNIKVPDVSEGHVFALRLSAATQKNRTFSKTALRSWKLRNILQFQCICIMYLCIYLFIYPYKPV